jgi:hypothetical protein
VRKSKDGLLGAVALEKYEILLFLFSDLSFPYCFLKVGGMQLSDRACPQSRFHPQNHTHTHTHT